MKIAMRIGAGALLITVLALAGCGGGGTEPNVTQANKRINIKSTGPDAYDVLRGQWQALLTGGSSLNASDPDIANQISVITSNAQTYWSSMNTAAGNTYLWSDLNTWTSSGNIDNNYVRLYAMALAYATPGSSLQGNATLASNIAFGLDWLNANYYNTSITYFDNWYDWQIGIPKRLDNIMTLLYANLTATEIANYTAAIDYFVPDPTTKLSPTGTILATETGANLLDKCTAVIMRGVIGKSSTKISQGVAGVSGALPYVTSGDGFYIDGSFIQHTDYAYVGGYGTVLIADMADLIYLLNGSTWNFTDPNIANVYAWVQNSFVPFMYDGALLDSVTGRGQAREFASDHENGRGLIQSLVLLAQGAPSAQAALINAEVKGWMQRDTTFGSDYFTPVATYTPGVSSGVSLYPMVLLKALAANNSVTAAAEPVATQVFASQDRVTTRQPGFLFDLSMFSPIIGAFENGNLENTNGWWTGMGAALLHNADETQFDNNYWATVNMQRLPGTTTDRSGSGTPLAWHLYPNTNNWVGGSNLSSCCAAVGMGFATKNVTGTSLTGLKSWFVFGGKIVEMGAGISSTDSVNIETIVDNRMLDAAGDNTLTVDGTVMPTTIGWSAAMPSVQWAQLNGNVTGTGIGYYFPGSPTVNALREARTGNWYAIDQQADTNTATNYTNNFLSLSLSQGTNPTAGTYTDVILPNYTAAQTAAYAAAPTVTVLENDTSVNAAYESSLNVVGATFWQKASKTINLNGQPYLTSSTQAAVLTQLAGNVLTVSVADPTQANTGSITVTVNAAAGASVTVDPSITVVQMSPSIILSVNVNASAGRSFLASFRLFNTVNLPATANAYTENGTGAGTNFGGGTNLYIKDAATSYYRQAYLMFNLSSISGTISSANLMLASTSFGQSGMTNDIYLVPNNSWTESTLTWNNQPALGSMLGSWTVPAVNAYASLGVTSAAQSAQSGGTPLSFCIQSPTNYGSNGWVEYGSRENNNPAVQPVLQVTSY